MCGGRAAVGASRVHIIYAADVYYWKTVDTEYNNLSVTLSGPPPHRAAPENTRKYNIKASAAAAARAAPAALPLARRSNGYRRRIEERRATFRPRPPPPILAAIGGGWPPMTRSRTHTPIPINRSAAAAVAVVLCARRMTTLFFPTAHPPTGPRHRRRRSYRRLPIPPPPPPPPQTLYTRRSGKRCACVRVCVCGRSPAAAPSTAHRYRQRPTRPTGFRSLHPRTDFPSCSNGTPHPVLSVQTPPR